MNVGERRAAAADKRRSYETFKREGDWNRLMEGGSNNRCLVRDVANPDALHSFVESIEYDPVDALS